MNTKFGEFAVYRVREDQGDFSGTGRVLIGDGIRIAGGLPTVGEPCAPGARAAGLVGPRSRSLESDPSASVGSCSARPGSGAGASSRRGEPLEACGRSPR